MKRDTINDFIKELQAISSEKRKLPLVIDCPNGLEVYPKIKMRLKEGFHFPPEVEKMVITWNG